MSGKPVDILIVEDNYSFALELEMLLKELGYHSIAHLEEGEQALQWIQQRPPDLILMDMHIKGPYLGVEIAEQTAHLRVPTLFISVAHGALYERAQKLPGTIGYLVKPVHPITLQSAIDLALAGVSRKEERPLALPADTLVLKQDQTYYKVGVQEVLYGHSEGNYVRVCTLSGFYLIRSSLKSFLMMLPPRGFLRVHRQYIVALEHLRAANFMEGVVQVGGHSIPLGERYMKGLQDLLKG
ncbi:LytR/AlgR family response regulator transcription factor [Phaeodactylibacter luteus]|uniref:Response regulator transcription factor n=1 Tax=Phaeodactylibacter luteus TaxID=1564516 RepID=A0A5C6RND5_9BACT|nr:response regulator transcription factor [Phaeodactylibacter luteus]TXB63459.1 response regulator transcription factor [Phaeodactylibacter luteus]